MLLRLLALAVSLWLLAGCAQPPKPELEVARTQVARAYAAGASQLAPAEYRAAKQALSAAVRLVDEGEYGRAREALRLARQHADRALRLVEEEKQRIRELRLEEEKAKAKAKTKPKPKKKPLRVKAKPKKKVKKQPPPPEPKPVNRVEVGEGETLSTLAARPEVFADPLLWPLLYKANRDQIKDPQQVFPGQILTVPRDKTAQEIEAAREEARRLDLFR